MPTFDPHEFNRRRDRIRRENESFDRTWRWLWPVALVLGLLGAIVTIALYAGAAAWLWGLIG